MHHPTLLAVGIAALVSMPGAMAGMYPKSSAVLQVDGKSYDRLIAQSNYTSIVEFYAPWCGHCKNLQPAYEKAAKSLEGLAKVAAVDCDDDANKPLCGQFGIQGFPTLKIIRPGKKSGKPAVEDYNGPRTATGIVDALVDKINNHVKKVTDKDLDAFVASGTDKPRAILFTEKGTTSPLLRSIAIDFLDVITIAQARNNQKAVVEKYGIEKFPTLILLPVGASEPIVYDGAMKKPAIVEFLSQAGTPNPDPPVKAGKKAKSTPKAEPKAKAAEEKPAPEAAAEDVVEEPVATPAAPAAAPIPSVDTAELQKECLAPKSHTCILALVPTTANDKSEKVLGSLAELAHKYTQGGRHLFPFYAVSGENPSAATLTKTLSLKTDVELVAVNARRAGEALRGRGDAASVELD
ncbi:disulfide-isomerase A6 [Verticillium alfalfae VaMs.102]|uniref:protein disulfide-isomerase n=1 Tax=Verticillium alfalfae (strain VaMs.102 / ATCC MYA-4576 / FGSC 10136) TaxID=526221 RepID=C9SYF8_VERA1|nr:disulfide-isomerase A6 [Verticillium alfalfae VaMs.102]EEY23823.1 disulfide-isomerase A6 [Verticillium alfalfae VaMs.102]